MLTQGNASGAGFALFEQELHRLSSCPIPEFSTMATSEDEAKHSQSSDRPRRSTRSRGRMTWAAPASSADLSWRTPTAAVEASEDRGPGARRGGVTVASRDSRAFEDRGPGARRGGVAVASRDLRAACLRGPMRRCLCCAAVRVRRLGRG